jgi:hypothetical protein
MALSRRAFLALAAALPALHHEIKGARRSAKVMLGAAPATYDSAVYDTAVFG